jgi:hypothetical protein
MEFVHMADKAKKVNYSDEDVSKLRTMYAELGNDGLDEIAKALNKGVRSVRAKLVRDGLYVAPDKSAKAPKEDGPSKKELLMELEAKGFSPEGFEGATKDAIKRVISLVAA